MKDTVLLVDDEPAVVSGLRNVLRKEPYDIVTASSAAEGLKILAERKVDVIVSDERMPGMSGSEFLAVACKEYPTTIRIILSGQASLDSAIRAINEGEIYRFLLKPCQPVQLAHTIHDALLLRDLKRESAHLLAASRGQRSVIEDLEKLHPGITRVEHSRDGSIVIDDSDQDTSALILQMKAEADRAMELLEKRSAVRR
jgi:DNA-binding NtrC family response regulator